MADKLWKQFERRVANYFGTKRNPLSGNNSGHSASDTLHPELYIEAKMRKQWSVITLFHDVNVKAKKEGKIPLLAIGEKNKRGFLLCFKSEDIDRIIREREILQ